MNRILTLAVTAILAAALGYGIARFQSAHELDVARENAKDFQRKWLEEQSKLQEVGRLFEQFYWGWQATQVLFSSAMSSWSECLRASPSRPASANVMWDIPRETQEISKEFQRRVHEMGRQWAKAEQLLKAPRN